MVCALVGETSPWLTVGESLHAAAACGKLGAFLNEADALEGRKLTAAQADLLRAEATRIRSVLGCR